MKTLITASEIKQYAEMGEKSIYVNKQAIITPAANDSAKELGIKFIIGEELKNESINDSNINDIKEANLEQDLIAKIVAEVMKVMSEPSGLFQLSKEADPSGLRLIKGNNIVLEKFDTGNPEHNVKIREILNIKESPNLVTGFMTLEETKFDWKVACDEINYITEGTLELIIDGKNYVGNVGDVFFIPGNTQITFSAPNMVKLFFVAYPASRADSLR